MPAAQTSDDGGAALEQAAQMGHGVGESDVAGCDPRGKAVQAAAGQGFGDQAGGIGPGGGDGDDGDVGQFQAFPLR